MNAYEAMRSITDIKAFIDALKIRLKEITGQELDITLGQSDLDIDPYQKDILVLVKSKNIDTLLEIDISNIPKDVFTQAFFTLVISNLKNKMPQLFI